MSRSITVVDTNVLLRYFIRDDPEGAQAFDRLRAKARAGEIKLVLLPIVFLELGWVLEKFYRLPREDVATYLEATLSAPEISVEMEGILVEALSLYRKGIKLADALLVAWARAIGAEMIWTFDQKDFRKAAFPYKRP